MKLSEKVAVILFVVLFVAAWGLTGERYEEVFDQSYPLAAGGAVSLDNVNGDVSIEVWDSDQVLVHAVKRASSLELLAKLKVEVASDGTDVRVRTEYPSSRGWDEDGEQRDRHMSVEYTVTVPRFARIADVDLVNGDLSIVGVEGGMEAETVNGDITVRQSRAPAELETVNGGLEVWFDRLDDGDRIELSSVNGAVDLHLVAGVSARVSAETVNGSLSNDFDIEVRKGKYVGASFEGSIGGGGAKVDLETVNGSIAVDSW
jgi:hypothetical protein